MTANEPNDDTPNKSPGSPDGGTVLNVSGEDTASTMAEYPTRTARPTTELWLPDDDTANLDVYAYDYTGEPGQVELCVGIPGAHLTLTLTPADANALADDLDDAARRADDDE
jgi:hypothetical protein